MDGPDQHLIGAGRLYSLPWETRFLPLGSPCMCHLSSEHFLYLALSLSLTVVNSNSILPPSQPDTQPLPQHSAWAWLSHLGTPSSWRCGGGGVRCLPALNTELRAPSHMLVHLPSPPGCRTVTSPSHSAPSTGASEMRPG